MFNKRLILFSIIFLSLYNYSYGNDYNQELRIERLEKQQKILKYEIEEQGRIDNYYHNEIERQRQNKQQKIYQEQLQRSLHRR